MVRDKPQRFWTLCGAILSLLMLPLLAQGDGDEAERVAAPEILPRTAWEAAPADVDSGVLKPIGEVRHVTAHHTAVGWLRGDSAESELQAIQRGHRDDNGWGDIAYHYLIAPDGRIFAGRSPEYAVNSGTRYLSEEQWKRNPIFTPDDQAATTEKLPLGGTQYLPESATGPRPGNVEGHVTICLLGNFMEEEPTDEAKDAFVSLCAYLLQEYDLTIRDVWLHREVASSLCPGDAFYSWLRAYPGGERYSLGEGLRRVAELVGGEQ